MIMMGRKVNTIRKKKKKKDTGKAYSVITMNLKTKNNRHYIRISSFPPFFPNLFV